MRVIVTRPQAQAQAWVERLREQGFECVALPLIRIDAAPDTHELHRAWATLAQRALVVFVSPSAAQAFFAQRPAALEWPAAVLAGSIGPGTSAVLRAERVAQTCIVEPGAQAPQFDSEALWESLAARDWRGRDVLIVRGDGGRDWLAQTLRDAGAQVQWLAAYRRLAPQLDAAQEHLLADALREPQAHVWLFSSSEAIVNLCRMAPQADWSGAQALATHPAIAATAHGHGFGAVIQTRPGVDEVAQALRGRWPPRCLQSPSS